MSKKTAYVSACDDCGQWLTACDCLNLTLRSAEPGHCGGGGHASYHKTCFATWLYTDVVVLPVLSAKDAIKTLNNPVLNKLTANLPNNEETLCIFCNTILLESDSVAIDFSNDDPKRSHPCVKKTYFCCKECARCKWPTDGYVEDYLQTTAQMNKLMGIEEDPTESAAIDTESNVQKSEGKNREPASVFEKSLQLLLDQLETIGETHEELYDTDCREQMSAAVMKRFLAMIKGSRMPQHFGMFSDDGNLAVRSALDAFIKTARKCVKSEELDTFHVRLVAFQNEQIVSSNKQLNYEEFFGYLEPEHFSKDGETRS